MTTSSFRLLPLAILGLAAPVVTGCAVNCIEDATGTKCTAKSLKRYDGQPPAPIVFDPTPGAPLNVDVQYGNIALERSTTGKFEVHFKPYAYAAYDNPATAQEQISKNLQTSAGPAAGGTVVSVRRAGGTNGLGADVLVRVPDGFTGLINVVNHGNGPVNNFDLKVAGVGGATALNVTNKSSLGNCWVQAAPNVRTTNVQCAGTISVFDVSDTVNINNTGRGHDGPEPAVTLRLAGSAGGGGNIQTATGSVALILPAAGGYVVNAKSPVRGTVQEGALPGTCTKTETGPNAKVITCGTGPAYNVSAGTQANPNSKLQGDNNITLQFK